MADHDAASASPEQLDALIARLRARAADPERRADVIVDAFSAQVRTMDLGSLMGMGRSVAGDLGRLLGQIRTTGTVSPDLQARAESIGQLMSTPARPDLPAVATGAAVAQAEATLGRRLPDALRRAWLEVANGGVGPGSGLLSVEAATQAYADMRRDPEGPRGATWPEGLLPVVAFDPGYDCVDLDSGKVITWDPEDLTERSGEAAWRRTFREVAPSVEAWLTTWVGSKTQAEQVAERMAASQVEQARAARAHIAAMTPEARAAMGLPEVGWERVVWGGIGLDEDEDGAPEVGSGSGGA